MLARLIKPIHLYYAIYIIISRLIVTFRVTSNKKTKSVLTISYSHNQRVRDRLSYCFVMCSPTGCAARAGLGDAFALR